MTTLLAAGCVPNLHPGPVPAELASDSARVVTVPATPGDSFVIHASVSAGSVHDRPGTEGLAALVAHTFAHDLSVEVAALDGSLVVDAGRDTVEITLECPVPRADPCLSAWARAWSSPLDKDQWEAARARAHDALHALVQDPIWRGQELLDALIFEGHRYAHPSLGRAGVLPVLPVDQGVRFRQSHWVRRSVVVGVAGSWSEPHVARVAASLAALPARIPPAPTRFSAQSRTGRELVVVSGSGDTWIHLGHAVPPDATAEERFYLALGASVLSEWSAGMHVTDGWDRQHPSLELEVMPGDATAVDATAHALAALERLHGGIQPGELSRLRVAMGRLLDQIEQTPAEGARSAALHQLTSRPSVSDRRAWLEAATPEAVNQVLAEHVRPGDVKIVVGSATVEPFESAVETLGITHLWESSTTAWLR